MKAFAFVLALVLLPACESQKVAAPPSADHAAPPRAPLASAPPSTPASVATAASASPDAAASIASPPPTVAMPTPTPIKPPKTLDTKAWMKAPERSELHIQWIVDRSKAKPPINEKDFTADLNKNKVPLTLVMTLDGVTIALALDATGGSASPDSCGSVGFFWAGRKVVFAISRISGTHAVLRRIVTSESADTRADNVTTFEIPDVTLTQQFDLIETDGRATSNKCAAERLPMMVNR